MKSTTNTEPPQCDCGGEEEYIIHQTDFKEKGLELDPATTCGCDKI